MGRAGDGEMGSIGKSSHRKSKIENQKLARRRQSEGGKIQNSQSLLLSEKLRTKSVKLTFPAQK
jgi:hypothetical protein